MKHNMYPKNMQTSTPNDRERCLKLDGLGVRVIEESLQKQLKSGRQKLFVGVLKVSATPPPPQKKNLSYTKYVVQVATIPREKAICIALYVLNT